MAKLDFSTYQKRYNYIKKKEKRTIKKNKKNKAKLKAKEMEIETLKTYHSLKEELGNIKNKISLAVCSKEDILNTISKNEEHINGLITSLEMYKNDILKSHSNDFFDFNILNLLFKITFNLALGIVCGIMINFISCLIFHSNFMFSNLIIWGFISSIILDVIMAKMTAESSIITSFYQFVMSRLPIHNKYRSIKLIRNLKDLKRNYRQLEQEYENYIKYVAEVNPNVNNIQSVKVKIEDPYLLEMAKLATKINKLRNLEDQKKYTITLTKIGNIYKQELEKMILQHGNNHNNEEINFKNNIIKQLAYLEMQVDQLLYKESKITKLKEDYATTTAIIENKGVKRLLKR